MKIVKKFAAKVEDNWNVPNATIAFLGASTMQGCFEIYWRTETEIDTIFESRNSIPRHVSEIINLLYPKADPTIVNAAISGDNAIHAAQRLEKDVLRHNPDLTVVSLLLNDAGKGRDMMGPYLEALESIFDRLQAAGSEIIFKTPNMMCTSISPFVHEESLRDVCRGNMETQLSGILDEYVEAAIALCNKKGIKVCDCYHTWKQMYAGGVNITELLANKCNHPIRELTWYPAMELVKCMFED